jgi:hypothetical protein
VKEMGMGPDLLKTPYYKVVAEMLLEIKWNDGE